MSRKLHLLCIDDEVDILEMIRLCLSFDGGFSVSICNGGAEALDVLDRARPDLILLDVLMPGMDGPATLRAIQARQATRDIPVIFMSARAEGFSRKRFLELGAIGLVPKPFDPVTLASEIRKAYDAWPGPRAGG
jgi:two-component system OmpR family response regulator